MNYFYSIITGVIIAVASLAMAGQTFAQVYQYLDGCSSVGQCVGGTTCVARPNEQVGIEIPVRPVGAACGGGTGSSVIGGVPAPGPISRLNYSVGNSTDGIGIVLFISNLLTLFTIIVGVWVLFNVLKAGALFINSAGDTGSYEKVREILTTSVIGVTIIASAYILAGAIGWIIFGDPSFILRPTLMGAI